VSDSVGGVAAGWRFIRHLRYSGSYQVVEGVVGVPMGLEGIEGLAVVVVERQAKLDALGQIGVSNEMPSEGDRVGVVFFDDLL
jgi:hypothetical protein